MQSIPRMAFALLLALGFAITATPVHGDDGCIDFKWDVSKERALFAGTPSAIKAGMDAKSAPVIVPNRLYKLRLAAPAQVTFALSPLKKKAAEGAFAGLARLKISAAGSYRVAIDVPVWIDVVSRGALVAAKDYEGQHNCSAPHKIVEFELSGAQPLILQFSNGRSENILLTVTPTPARKL
ncbi:MAG: hypothetical protein ABJD53_07660 [Gammaproteobacteria bacterium]